MSPSSGDSVKCVEDENRISIKYEYKEDKGHKTSSLIFGLLSSPQLEKMLEPQVWREAATQVFFALGLGFGGVIAFSSYNKRDNNCHFDAALVSLINFVTSILATLVVFAVLGFKANVMNEKCVVE